MARGFRAPNINARRLECTPEWLARVETGFEVPSPAEVERILVRYQCRDARKADLLIDWASRPDGPEWLAVHLDRMPAAERDILTMESEASIIRAYRFRHIPALLQAEPYARLLLPYTRTRSGEVDVDAEWSLLDSRQRHHAGTGQRFLDVIIDEGILKFTLKSVPPDVRAVQLRHLIERDADPFTTIRIVPWNAPITEDRINPFDIFEFPEASDHVTVAYSLAGASLCHLDGTPTWDQVDRELALPADESRELIRHHLTEIEAT